MFQNFSGTYNLHEVNIRESMEWQREFIEESFPPLLKMRADVFLSKARQLGSGCAAFLLWQIEYHGILVGGSESLFFLFIFKNFFFFIHVFISKTIIYVFL